MADECQSPTVKKIRMDDHHPGRDNAKENIATSKVVAKKENEEVVTILRDLKAQLNMLIYRDLFRQIFLNLPPTSLKRARLVCREWDQLIKEEVWESKEGRKVMERRLEKQWREVEPIRKDL